MIVHSVTFTRYPRPAKPPCPAPKLILRTFTPVRPEKASLVTKMTRLRRELTTWAKAGLPLATKEVRTQRLAICATCDLFNPAGNLGLGECRAPGCGCSKVKAALATSRCPLNKWPR